MQFTPHMPEFGYPVSRPYPYRWFSWVVVVGGIIATVLFSLINFAANGYQLEVQYSTNPNATESQDSWTTHWPSSWFTKLSTSCQGQILQVNSQFFTDKQSLPYTVTGVWQNETGLKILPSLQYMNHFLQNCTVNEMVFEIESSSRTANEQDFGAWGIDGTVCAKTNMLPFARAKRDNLGFDHMSRVQWQDPYVGESDNDI